MRLSPHFTLDELARSETALRHGRNNHPGPDEIANLERLCRDLLEPTRALLGVPLHVNSGFRTLAVNTLVGGSKTSAHMDGRAADVFPVGMDLRQAFDWIRGSTLPFDQAIEECGAWLHLAIARDGEEPRRQALVASGGPGQWTYSLVPLLGEV